MVHTVSQTIAKAHHAQSKLVHTENKIVQMHFYVQKLLALDAEFGLLVVLLT